MPKSYSSQIVEIPCKTTCKTQCNKYVKLCVNPTNPTTRCAKQPVFRHFFTTNTPPFTQPPTPIVQLFYPLFHQAYYYNY